MSMADDVFPRAYVEELRRRGDGYRRRANTVAVAAIRYAVIAELLKRKVDHRLADKVNTSGVTIDADGFVQGVETAVQSYLSQH